MNTWSLIALITAIDTVTLVLILLWLRGKSRRSAETMTDSAIIFGEEITIQPEPAMYTGSSGRYSKIKGNGVIELTDKYLRFKKLLGSDLEIPIEEIQSVSDDLWFLGSFHNFHKHLILTLKDGTKVGFQMKDHEKWMRALREVTSSK